MHDDELFRIVCSCEMNASQIKAAMIQHVKAILGIPDTDPKGKDKDKEDSESESECTPAPLPPSLSRLACLTFHSYHSSSFR